MKGFCIEQMMKIMRIATLKANAVMLGVIGVFCVAGGLYTLPLAMEMRNTFVSGKLSVGTIKEQTGIHERTDLATRRERLLLGAVWRTNHECQKLCHLLVDASLLLMMIGLGIVLFAVNNGRLAKDLTKELAEHAGRG